MPKKGINTTCKKCGRWPMAKSLDGDAIRLTCTCGNTFVSRSRFAYRLVEKLKKGGA